MKNLLLLGTLSFTIAFSCGLVVEKNVTKSAAIGAIATISTLSSGLVLSKISEKERQKLQGHTEKVKSLESQISSLTEKKTNLVKVINNKTRSKTKVEQEYNAKLKEIDQLKEEINSLKLQRDTLQDVILNLETKEKKLLRLIDPKTSLRKKIDKKPPSLLVKNKEPKEETYQPKKVFREENTLYAKKIAIVSQDFWSIYEYNIDIFRSQIPRRDWGNYWSKLAHGFNILYEENTLLAYLAFYGGSHYYKMFYLLDRLFSELSQAKIEASIDIIDYGCGQALGTTCLLDYVRHNIVPNISINAITLIEPSDMALSRGILHIHHLLENSDDIDIKSINKHLEYLNLKDLSTSKQNLKIHIFSNILDVSGFEIDSLANTIRHSQSGMNYFLCVSPTDFNNRIEKFFKFWDQNGCFTEEIKLSAEDLYRETWRFKLDEFKREKIHRVQKLFSVKL